MGVEQHTNQAEEPRLAWGFRTQHGPVNDLVNNSDSLGGNSACLQVVNGNKSKVGPCLLVGECSPEHVHTEMHM